MRAIPPDTPTVIATAAPAPPPPLTPQPTVPRPQPIEETPTLRVSATQLDLAAAESAPAGDAAQPWRDELSERVEKFRKRRARLQPDDEPAQNLELNFGEPDSPADQNFLDGALVPFVPEDQGSEVELGEPAIAFVQEDPPGETLVMDAPQEAPVELETAPFEPDEMGWGEPLPQTEAMEIQVGSPPDASHEGEEAEGILIAPLGRRFLAGLTDALVLLLGAAVFGVIFWRFCGRISLAPLNVAVLGVAAILEIFAYFGVFTALASATPGLLWCGCEVRNLRGAHPTVPESLWRALGVLVSLSALMLGFVWACVDSDRLTWHDRMSGTVIAEAKHSAHFVQQTAQT